MKLKKYGHEDINEVDVAIDEFRRTINDLVRIREEMISDNEKWYKVCSSMDAIDHSEAAIKSFLKFDESNNLGEIYLIVFGLFQNMIVQQDAVKSLFESLDSISPIKSDPELLKIRDLRNDCVGHPTNRNHGVDPRSNFFYTLEWSKDHFTLNRTFHGDSEQEFVDIYPKELIDKQRTPICMAIETATSILKDRENNHREKFKDISMQKIFNGITYNFEKIHTHFDYGDSSRFHLAQRCFEELRNQVIKFTAQLNERGLGGDESPGIKIVLNQTHHPLMRLGEYFDGQNVDQNDAKSFARDLNNLCDELLNMAGEIDEEYNTEL